jgi:hypothetical protein
LSPRNLTPGVRVRFSREGMTDTGVVKIAGDLVGEVAVEVMGVALLPHGGGVIGDAPAVDPGDPLGHETTPDVGHAEGAEGRQVQ